MICMFVAWQKFPLLLNYLLRIYIFTLIFCSPPPSSRFSFRHISVNGTVRVTVCPNFGFILGGGGSSFRHV